MKKTIDSIKNFCSEVGTEMKKTTWPTREELWQSTLVVIFSLVLLSAFVALSDKAVRVILRILTL